MAGSIKSEKSVNALIDALRDEDYNVRSNAAEALKKKCTVSHKDVLEEIKRFR